MSSLIVKSTILKVPKHILHVVASHVSRRANLEYFVLLLCAIGMLNTISNSMSHFLKQLMFSVFGYTLFRIARLGFVRLRLRKVIPFLYVLSIFLLVLVLFTSPVKGASRWFYWSGISLQPGEIAKMTSIFGIAFTALYVRAHYLKRLHIIFFQFCLILLTSFLIFLQPDFGTAFLIAASGTIYILFINKIKPKEFLIILLIVALLGAVSMLALKDFQKQRILSYVSSLQGKQVNESYNSLQAKIAVGSGGILGKGLGRGTQSGLAFLPEDHTDFAFSAFSEQFGFGGVVILILILFFVIREMIVSIPHSTVPLVRLALPGFLFIFIFQTFINILMNLGVLPVVGVPLPLISYGGSSLLLWFFVFGLF